MFLIVFLWWLGGLLVLKTCFPKGFKRLNSKRQEQMFNCFGSFGLIFYLVVWFSWHRIWS